MSRRSPFAALALAVLVAVACSVYGPADLVGPDTNPFESPSGGLSGSGNFPSYGGYTFGGSTQGGGSSGGSVSGGRAASGTGGASGGRSGGAAGMPATQGGSGSIRNEGGAPAAGGKASEDGGAGSSSSAGSNSETGGMNAAGASSSGGSSSGGSSPALTGGSNSGGGSGSGSAGGASNGGSPATGGSAPLAPELIDNMEDGNAYILKNDGRDGPWYTAFGTGGKAEPPANNISMALLDGVVAAPSSKRGFHFSGDGGEEWGALCGFDFIYVGANKPKLPYDASRYKGVEFWIKGAAATTITLRVPLKDTSAAANGKCTETADSCENHFKTSVDLTTSWQKVSLRWSGASAAFAQEPWGYTLPAFDPTQLVSLHFMVGKGDSAEFWLDDISFIP